MISMNETLKDIENKIILSLQREIIIDDLLEEKDVYSFEKKKRWLLQWEEEMTKKTGYEKENSLLSFQGLKETVVTLKKHGIDGYSELLLERCCNFRPYHPMPGWDDRELRKMEINIPARELTLEKICILLGFEEDRFEALQGDFRCSI